MNVDKLLNQQFLVIEHKIRSIRVIKNIVKPGNLIILLIGIVRN